MISRRESLKSIAKGLGVATFGSSIIPNLASASTTTGGVSSGGPKRVIFFLQNQGFDLEPFKEKMHIINGLHGKHTSPSHSAFFGALGGYRGSDGVPPRGATIDYVLSKFLPESLLPHLCIGMDSICIRTQITYISCYTGVSQKVIYVVSMKPALRC